MAPRVLILTASFGSGHNAAADALAAAFRAAGAGTRVVDHFRELVHPAFDRWSRRLYDTMLRRAPGLWSLAYRTGDRMTPASALTFNANRLGSARGQCQREYRRSANDGAEDHGGSRRGMRKAGKDMIP